MIHPDIIERLTTASRHTPGEPVFVKTEDLRVILRELNRCHNIMENVRRELREGDPFKRPT